MFRALLHRAMLWIPVAVLAAALLGAAGFYFFTGWRARDLAERAMDNARSGNLQMARLQAVSAGNLRAHDPIVQRTQLYVRSRLNDPAAPSAWEQLAEEQKLNHEELEEWARSAMLSGTDEQFDRADGALAQAGMNVQAAALRSARQARRGNLSESIAEARAAAQQSGAPAEKLVLLRLLLARHAPMLNTPGWSDPAEKAGRDEITALVDGLLSTPQANEALALALSAFPLTTEKALAWAQAALADLSPSNPALCAAAQIMVLGGAGSADEYARKLAPVFAGAGVAQQADFARWLNRQRKWDDSLALITPAKAAQNTAAWEARAQALAGLERWQELLAMSEAVSSAPESLRLVYRGAAAQKLGRSGIAPKALADSVRAAVREGTLPQTLRALDSLGEGKLADPILVEMCGSPGLTDAMFRVARDRFGRRGQFTAMSEAWEAAARAAPKAPSVQDYRRRMLLLAGEPVSSEETAAAVAAAPADHDMRFTHALALLREGRPGDALGVFHDIDIFVDGAPPGHKVIVIAILEANGMNSHAAAVRRSLNTDLLSKEEYVLIMR